MSRSPKDSIHAPGYRARFFVIVVLFSLFLCALGLGLGERIVREDRAASVREVNQANAKALAADFGFAMKADAERIRAWGRTSANADDWSERLRTDSEIVSVTIYAPTAHADYWEPRVSSQNAEFAKLYAFTPKRLEKLRRAIPVPFARVVAEGQWLTSAAADSEAPLVTLAVALDGEAVAVADVRTERWTKQKPAAGEVFLIDARGNAIAHPDLKAFARAFGAGEPPLATVPLVKQALSVPEVPSLNYEWDGRRWMGAAADTGFAGARAIAQISESSAFEGVSRLRRHAGLLALLGLSLAMFGAAWLVRGPVAVPSEARPEQNPAHAHIAEEFLTLLVGVRSRIEQIRARAMQPLGSTPHDPEPLREALADCGQRLESLSEQAAWATEIFRKLRKVGLERESDRENVR